MSAAAVLVIAVAVGEAANPTTAAMLAATAQSLGPNTSIRLLEATSPFQTDAARAERELGAGAVVALAWAETQHLHATIRVHVASSDIWTTRAISFTPSDRPNERGRMLGLAIATMWPEGVSSAPRAPPVATTGPRPSPRRASNSVPPPALETDVAAIAGARASRVKAREPRPPVATLVQPPAPPERTKNLESNADAPSDKGTLPPAGGSAAPRVLPRRYLLGLSALGGLAIGGPPRAFGGIATGAWFPAETLALRVGLGVRGGPISALPGGALLESSVGAGVEWWPTRLLSHSGWSFGLRADLLALGQRVSSSRAGGQGEVQSRVLLGSDVLVQARYQMTWRLALHLGLGAEVAAGKTDLRTGTPPVTVATVPWATAVAEAGLSLRF